MLRHNGQSIQPDVNGMEVVDVEDGSAWMALVTRNGKFSLSYGSARDEVMTRAHEGLTIDTEQTLASRLATYHCLPRLDEDRHDQLLCKCFSVMRVNTCGPEGIFRQHWSTTSRLPHRWLWLWDSAFHAVGMCPFDAPLAWEFLESVFDGQRDDGMVPHCVEPSGLTSHITQPPLLAWAAAEVARMDPNISRIEAIVPKLAAYLQWDLNHRDQNGNGLLEWHIEGNPQCRSGESGLDNSPRFDKAVLLDAVDFSSLLAHDMARLAGLYQIVGNKSQALAWLARSRSMQQRVHDGLWDERQGGYRDRRLDGMFGTVDAISNLFALLLDQVEPARVERLCHRIAEPGGYGSTMPLGSVAIDDPTWCHDMWRGPTWLNTAYLVILGLRRHGRLDLANELAGHLVDGVGRRYRQHGVLFEFYDAADQVDPASLDRKGSPPADYDLRGKMSCIRDYHWTAAVTARLLLDLHGEGKRTR